VGDSIQTVLIAPDDFGSMAAKSTAVVNLLDNDTFSEDSVLRVSQLDGRDVKVGDRRMGSSSTTTTPALRYTQSRRLTSIHDVRLFWWGEPVENVRKTKMNKRRKIPGLFKKRTTTTTKQK
jgi:hypothetical protein